MPAPNAPLLEQLRFTLHCPNLLSAKASPFAQADTPSPNDLALLLSTDQTQLRTDIGTPKSHFIGPLFETLWCHYIKHSRRYELVARNIQLNDSSKTIGELDLIAYDHETEQWLHQELAIKFYLHDSEQDLWIGPNAIDRLDLKLQKFEQQLSLSHHPQLSKHLPNLDLSKLRSEVVLKGMLFHQDPDAPRPSRVALNPEHWRGRWQKLNVFLEQLQQDDSHQEQTPNSYWQILSKAWWLVPEHSEALRALPKLNNEQLRDRLNSNAHEQRAHLILHTQQLVGREQQQERIMVMPEQWPTL